MEATTSILESALKRDRVIILAGLSGLTLLAWAYMWHEASAMVSTGVCKCAGMKMSSPDMQTWAASQLLPLFLMWAEMMIAMMVPSAAPMVLMFGAVNRKRREAERPFVPTGMFLLGYLVVWTLFSAIAALAQWMLHAKALLSPMMASTSPFFGGAILLVAGVFQWTPLKQACLRHCRSPLSFLLTDWREGRLGALIMGIKHGAACTGCCWMLMALLFVAGVMNMWWVAAITILVLLEKVLPHGLQIGRAAGVALVLWGLWLLQTAFAHPLV